ncbi:hypothetical protein PPYR_06343 [Photinus pyralis]|uniref:CLIP domain-containing serine protease n=1 Tax=Photinus pyralis TaxID=7054 RepID=A0A5N4ATL6_PHOPY|nr:serine protease easter-like isoform X2 [Photinus pyralis]KAB0800603.1 hypothetical protein PPYR_06343 [Photinus pyralis]
MANYVGLQIFILWVHALSPSKQSDCTTPGKQLGQCISFQDCRELTKLYKSRPYHETAAYLDEARCGLKGEEEQMCCSINGNDFLLYLALITTSTTDTPNLLPSPDKCGREMGMRMFGGKVAELDEFPWMAILEYSKAKQSDSSFHCSGALISNRYVLTAAHCITAYRAEQWELRSVRLGEHTLQNKTDCNPFYCTKDPVNVPVEELITHELFDPNSVSSANNIALIRLQQEVVFTDFIHPICLPPTDNTDYTGLNMLISGWGQTEHVPKSGEKLKLRIQVTTQEKCITTYRLANVELKEGQICAGGVKGEDSCLGDGGGPLMLFNQTASTYFVAGITTFGNADCGTEDWPSVYTKVVNYIPWINSKLRP